MDTNRNMKKKLTRKKLSREKRVSYTGATLQRKATFRYALITEGIGVGVLAGLVVSLFRYILAEAETVRTILIEASGQKLLMALFSVGLLICMLIGAAFITGREPVSGGSGIPQVEAELKGKLNPRWARTAFAKFFGGLMAIGGGLSLGSEGPSVQLGAMMGKGFSRMNKRLKTEEKLLLTAGAGAGLATAFGAPLAGVVFTLEELHKNFSKEVLLTTMAASITADCIASYIFGLKPVFEFAVSGGLPLERIWMVLILGVILGLLGVLYNKTTFLIQDVLSKIHPAVTRLLIPFVMVMILVFAIPEAIGSGADLIEPAGEGVFGVKFLAALLAVKFVTSLVSFGTGLPGGTFLPMLVLGALIGGLYAELLGPAAGYSESYAEYFVILGMAGYFGAIVRAPITGVILISEMTGTFSNLLPLSMVVLVAYMTADVLKGGPLYEQLTDRLISGGKADYSNQKHKVLIESRVHLGSAMDERPLSEIDLPEGCLVVSVSRGHREVVPHGGTVIKAGDKLVVLCDEARLMEAQQELDVRCHKIVR